MVETYLPFVEDTPLPSRDRCISLWDKYGMLDNIRDHSRVVCQVALVVCDWLADAGVELVRPAVERGALLHDIAKTPCLGTEKFHHIEGQRIMASEGYPELGYMVYRHVVLPPGHPLDETMVVNYADKRVTHDRIVDLNSRYEYIIERYGRRDPEREERIRGGLDRALEVEREIFDLLSGRGPRDLDGLAGGAS